MDRYSVLDNPPTGCESVANLAIWAENEDFSRGTIWLEFLDLIGYSREHFGDTINQHTYQSGYIEQSKLAKALEEYATRPETVKDYIMEIELSAD